MKYNNNVSTEKTENMYLLVLIWFSSATDSILYFYCHFIMLLLDVVSKHKMFFENSFRSSHRSCFLKMAVLKISHDSQENTCDGVTFDNTATL